MRLTTSFVITGNSWKPPVSENSICLLQPVTVHCNPLSSPWRVLFIPALQNASAGTSHVGAGIAAATLGIVGNQGVARYKLRVGRRIQSATLISDAKHSWLDALSSAGALAGLIGVALAQREVHRVAAA